MKKTNILALLILAVFTLNGCMEKEAPKCSTTEVKNTVKKIYSQQMEKMKDNILMIAFMGTVPKTITSVDSIRAVAYDETVGLRSCKAEATLGEGLKSPIEYTVQLDEKNSNQFYVELQMDFIETLAQQGMMNKFMNAK